MTPINPSIDLDHLRAELAHPPSDRPEYRCVGPIDLFTRPDGAELSTQAAPGRQLWVRQVAADGGAIEVVFCEDDYSAWLLVADWPKLSLAIAPYVAPIVARDQIVQRIPGAIAFAEAALAVPNRYLWGGTIAPDYDCSGLIQAAFMSVGIWLPRNSYQQRDFTQLIAQSELQPGDLLFFGTVQKINHVALSLGRDRWGDRYLHSSGYEQGRGRIAIDYLSDEGDRVAQAYFSQYQGAGRIMGSYQPTLKQGG
ncbi:MAG: NlpC/P60 family protein [Oscillatoriales cyanobacterium]|nr:MAG: NlpC/P60 family protein [Oscillatoriales cyanobacterium]